MIDDSRSHYQALLSEFNDLGIETERARALRCEFRKRGSWRFRRITPSSPVSNTTSRQYETTNKKGGVGAILCSPPPSLKKESGLGTSQDTLFNELFDNQPPDYSEAVTK